MYKYKIYNKLSTSLSKIIDDDTEHIVGYIKKDYSNIFTRFIDLIGDGKFFNSFKIYNENKDLVFLSKQVSPFKYRHFSIKFSNKNIEPLSLNIKDKNWFKALERADFAYSNMNFELHKNIGDWAYITNKKTGSKVARWNNPLTSPTSNYFEILDYSFTEYKLLFLGIFHTYLYE
ncbi:tubby C-terminal domain-like protein [Staphylococcus xylosus]